MEDSLRCNVQSPLTEFCSPQDKLGMEVQATSGKNQQSLHWILDSKTGWHLDSFSDPKIILPVESLDYET